MVVNGKKQIHINCHTKIISVDSFLASSTCIWGSPSYMPTGIQYEVYPSASAHFLLKERSEPSRPSHWGLGPVGFAGEPFTS